MNDPSESGAQPVEDAAVAYPPTVGAVAAVQRRDHPEQAPPPPASATGAPGAAADRARPSEGDHRRADPAEDDRATREEGGP